MDNISSIHLCLTFEISCYLQHQFPVSSSVPLSYTNLKKKTF